MLLHSLQLHNGFITQSFNNMSLICTRYMP